MAVSLQQEQLLDAIVAACALVAYADGKVTVEERRSMLRAMRAMPALAAFSPAEVAAEFQIYAARFEQQPERARDHALRVIKSIVPRADDVALLLQACQHVMHADGIAHPAEYQAIGDVGRALADM